MNIPTAYKKVVDGFLIQPRSFTQLLTSAFGGATSLLNEKSRSEFIEKLDRGVINEGVISQATTGPLLLLSLFNDLQSPLFKKHKFDPNEFLEGVAPALERFHNVSGALENGFHKIQPLDIIGAPTTTTEKSESGTNGDTDQSTSSYPDGDMSHKTGRTDKDREDEKQNVLSIFQMYKKEEFFKSDLDEKQVNAILDHQWEDDAKKDPESLASQLSRMLTAELFQMHQISAKTAYVLQNHTKKYLFKEGSCSVNNVALLSARAFPCSQPRKQENAANESAEGEKLDSIDHDENNMDSSNPLTENEATGVAAQLEILYDVSQQFAPEPGNIDTIDGEAQEGTQPRNDKNNSLTTTTVNVATIEGWLNGGEDGELRWRLALLRPAFEFPGIPQSY